MARYGDPNPPNKPSNCKVGPWLPGLTLTEKAPQGIPPLESVVINSRSDGMTLEVVLQTDKQKYINVYREEYASSLSKFFTETTMSWLMGDGLLYRPGLKVEDVWKYDISGESDYGLVEPPINEPNYDLFDSNWSAQFIVFSRTTIPSCETLNLDWCSYGFTGQKPLRIHSNPNEQGIDIYKNCPKLSGNTASGMPTESEPSYMQLFELYKEINECNLIETHLGKNYLGCLWNEPNNPCSCNCPHQGVSFGDYLAYTRTHATFWDTPHYVPLYRKAQIGQLHNNIIQVDVAQLSKDIKLGDVINVNNTTRTLSTKDRRISGKWLLTEIEYIFEQKEQKTRLTLMRDTGNIKFKNDKIGWNPIYAIEGED